MTEQDSEHLILSVFSETLDEGLTERLSDFWSEHADTVLIVIDTLQRVRGRTPDNGSYAADYDTLARLKEFSDTYGVTVLVVHHTRKEGAEDVFNTISGTNGLMGAADGALLLHKDKRTASDAVLEVVGRDQPQLRLHLRFAAAHLCWELLEAETERLQRTSMPAARISFSAGKRRKPVVERHGDGACAMSFQDGQQPKLHAELDRADAECAAGYAAAEIRHSLCCPAHEERARAFRCGGTVYGNVRYVR